MQIAVRWCNSPGGVQHFDVAAVLEQPLGTDEAAAGAGRWVGKLSRKLLAGWQFAVIMLSVQAIILSVQAIILSVQTI